MKCRDCRNFSLHPPSIAAIYPNTDGMCDVAGSRDGNPDCPGALAYAMDGECYSAQLCVSADFGCLSFASRSVDRTNEARP